MNIDVMDAVCIALGENIEQFHLNACLDIVEAEMVKTPGEIFETRMAQEIERIHPDVELFYIPHHKVWAQRTLKRFYSFGFRVMNVKLIAGLPKRTKRTKAPRAELFDNPEGAFACARRIAWQLRSGLKYDCPPAERAHRPTRTKWARRFLQDNAHTHEGDWWKAAAA